MQRLTLFELIFIVLISNLFILYCAKNADYRNCVNYRMEFSLHNLKENNNVFFNSFKGFLIQIDECLHDKNCNLRTIETADDIGASLIFWLGTKLNPNEEKPMEHVLKYRDPSTHPLFVKVFYFLVHFLSIILLCVIGKRVLGSSMTLLIGLSLGFFENYFFISYSYDVYFFPIYISIFLLSFLELDKFSIKFFIFIGCLMGFFTWFRSSLFPFVLMYLLILLALSYFKKSRTLSHCYKILVTLCFAFFLQYLPNWYFSSAKHPFWHTIHAGLFANGGVQLTNGNFVPGFVYDNLPIKEPIFTTFNNWSDQVEYLTVKKVLPNAKIGSVEYENVLKNEYINFIKTSPAQSLMFYLKRLFIVFSFNPYKPHINNEYYETPYSSESFLTSAVFSVLFYILLFYFLFFVSCKIEFKLYLVILLIGTAAPGILTHPGLLTYNTPVVFIQWVLIFYFLLRRQNQHS